MNIFGRNALKFKDNVKTQEQAIREYVTNNQRLLERRGLIITSCDGP